jgi:hypothetical protein
VAKLTGYSDSQKMPAKEHVKQSYGFSPVPYECSRPEWCHVHHMFMEDGHTENGNHRLEYNTQLQIKARLAKWNRHFRGDHDISASTTRDSGVGPLFACFKEQNLFVRWERMVSTDPNVHANLSPFEWCMVGILYRARSGADINDALKKGADTGSSSDDWEEGDFPKTTDPKNLPYEFVIVYASVMSLLTSVKAWGTRSVTGRIQICADNMYDCLKGVPNMYWFNTGVMDAKGVHFPTVNALQLGRASPRNEVRSMYPAVNSLVSSTTFSSK